jgi:hypothetical protein
VTGVDGADKVTDQRDSPKVRAVVSVLRMRADRIHRLPTCLAKVTTFVGRELPDRLATMMPEPAP